MSELVLKKDQAKAVYDAMCALNNINARIYARDVGYTQDGSSIQVYETETGMICVGTFIRVLEKFGTQGRFAAAYELDEGL